MITIISPAKTLDMESQVTSKLSSFPDQLEKSQLLVNKLQKMKPTKLAELMGISPKLAQLNFDRYQQWHAPYNIEESKQAIFAFRGEVFTGIDIDSFSDADLEYTNEHLRILSGLYALLRPMDLIMAYRLEMGTKLKIGRKKNLYEFWGDRITNALNQTLAQSNEDVLLNLASQEYFKSINTKKLEAKIITAEFKDLQNGAYKVVSFFAKKARGLMAQFIMKNRISIAEEIKHFDKDGYFYNDHLSNEEKFVFTRA